MNFKNLAMWAVIVFLTLGESFTLGDHFVVNFVDDTEDEVKSFNITYRGKVYASDDAYEQDASAISGFNGNFELDTANTKTQYNLLKQCYLHLKTQEGFTDAVDC